jgi:glycosyltransferase involved in cell wall biosynthesis
MRLRVPGAVRRPAGEVAARLAGRFSAAHSRLLLVGDPEGWVISREMDEVARVARGLGVRAGRPWWAESARRQSLFYGSQFDFFARARFDRGNRLATAYFHGLPGTPGMPEFDECYDRLRRHHPHVDRLQVSHAEMRGVVLSSGIDPAKVFTIPIGVNLELFRPPTARARAAARREHGIPETAQVVGSLLKDGVGWGAGMEPKLIKGPDVLVEVLGRLRDRVPELFVVLAGPARGYVRAGLERRGIPYVHVWKRGRSGLAAVARLYHALDLCLVTSRQEGGPKAVLESMASGVPLVTTRVGQAMDIVRHGENGWVVDVDDTDGLVHWAEHALSQPGDRAAVVRCASETARAHSYDAQAGLWRAFLSGFVELAGAVP